jgi:hypothetical protein
MFPSNTVRINRKMRYYALTEDFLWKKLVPMPEQTEQPPDAVEWRIQTRNDRCSRRKQNKAENLKCVFPPVTGTYVATSKMCNGMLFALLNVMISPFFILIFF